MGNNSRWLLVCFLFLAFACPLDAIPPNDRFANRIILTGTNANSVPIAFYDAGVEPGETHGFHSSVWWEWTAPYTGGVGVFTTNSFLPPVNEIPTPSSGFYVFVYTGSTLSNLQMVSKPAYSSAVNFRATAGVTYKIAVAADLIRANLALLLREGPLNDHFEAAAPIELGITNKSTLLGATFQASEPSLPTNSFGATIWWKWNPPASGFFNLEARSLGSSILLDVFHWDSAAGLFPIGLPSAGPYGGIRRNNFPAATNETYYFRASDHGYVSQLTVLLRGSPPNDDFANALLVTNKFTYGTTLAATSEAGEPNLPEKQGRTVWYRWVPEFTRGCYFTLGPGQMAHNLLYLLKGDSLTNLQLIGDVIHSTTFPKSKSFLVTAGETYYVMVDSLAVGGDNFDFAFTYATQNDMFVDRFPAVIGGSGTTLSATREPDEPSHDRAEAAGSLWWEWRAPSSRGYYISGAEVHIYRGTNLATLQPVFLERRNGSQSFRAEEGELYQIALASAESGWFSFYILPGPANNDIIHAVPLRLSQYTNGNSLGVTLDSGEPRLGQGFGTSWFSFTPLQTGGYLANTSSAGSELRVYTGTSLDNLVSLDGRVEGIHSLRDHAFWGEAGKTYSIAVTSSNTFSIRVTQGATNDSFTAPAPLGEPGLSYFFSVWAATLEPGEITPWKGYSKGTLWWSWVSPVTGGFRIIVPDARGEAGLAVFARNNPDRLDLLAVREANGPVAVDFYAVVGVEYSICFGQTFTGPGSQRIYFQPAPAHDAFEGAVELGTAHSAEITAATRQPGEPLWGSAGNGTVWYQWTASSTDLFFLSADVNPGDIAVFTGDSLPNLQRMEGRSMGREFAISATQGTRYFIAVAINPVARTQSLTVLIKPRGPHDDFASPYLLENGRSTWSLGINETTLELGEPFVEQNLSSLWLSWQAPVSARHQIIAPGVGVEVFVGGALPAIKPVYEFSLTNLVTFHAQLGQWYKIRITTPNGVWKNFPLTIQPVQIAPTPPLVRHIPTSSYLTNLVRPTGVPIPSFFFTWTAPDNGQIKIHAHSTHVKVFHLHRPTLETNVHAQFDANSRTTNENVFTVTAQTSYLLEVRPSFYFFNTESFGIIFEPTQDSPLHELIPAPLFGGNRWWHSITNGVPSPPTILAITNLLSGHAGWIEAQLPGPGVLEYKVKTSGPLAASFYAATDSTTALTLAGTALAGTNDWTLQRLILPKATNIVRWTYRNLVPPNSTNLASAWIDTSAFSSPQPISVSLPIPYIGENGLFQLDIPVRAQQPVLIQFSLDLKNWYDWNYVSSPLSGIKNVPLPASNPAMYFRTMVR